MPSGGATSGDRPGLPGEGGGERSGEARGQPGARRTGASRARAGRPGPNGEAVPVAVTWDERQRRPVTFVWRRRRYRVERVLETWVLETGWWKDDGHVSRSYWRVRAEGRVVDLRYDRLTKTWALEREIA
jgi:hypothetical protein